MINKMKYKLLRNIDFPGKPKVLTYARKAFTFSAVLVCIIIIIRPGSRSSTSDELEEVVRNYSRTFKIYFKGNTFLLDGKPFRYVSGSIHYFRVPPEYWRDRLRKMRAAGLNAISTYVEWSSHEPRYRQYRWDGAEDLVTFIQIAQEEGLLVILRPGPYICAGRDMGGLPFWLLTKYPNIKLRTQDTDYLNEVSVWFDDLMSKMKPLLYGNGGPIIMVQVENEYASFPACDHQYMQWLQTKLDSWVGDAALLFTSDTSLNADSSCGKVPGAFFTVNFGTQIRPKTGFSAQRRATGGGPLVNSEFYAGWRNHWGEPLRFVSTAAVVRSLNYQLAFGANVNLYMFHGGTNFGFKSGANLENIYKPYLTSYDYDAPLNEAGDPTEKYFALKEVVSQYLPMPNIFVPEPTPKASYGEIILTRRMDLLGPLGRSHFGTNLRTIFEKAPTFEELGQDSGLLLYETILPMYSNSSESSSNLRVRELRDRAYVFVDGVYEGVLSRTYRISSIPLVAAQGKTLGLLVENQGRVNFGHLANDFKGILGAVTIGGLEVMNWNITKFPLTTENFNTMPDVTDKNDKKYGVLKYGPAVFKTKFILPDGTKDTFLNTTGWGKGIVWVNEYNLGRYWPAEGPQVSLYIPAVTLKTYPEVNTLYVLELLNVPEKGNATGYAMNLEPRSVFVNSRIHNFDAITTLEPQSEPEQKQLISIDRLVIV